MLLNVVAIGGDFEFLPSGSGVASMAMLTLPSQGLRVRGRITQTHWYPAGRAFFTLTRSA